MCCYVICYRLFRKICSIFPVGNVYNCKISSNDAVVRFWVQNYITKSKFAN